MTVIAFLAHRSTSKIMIIAFLAHLTRSWMRCSVRVTQNGVGTAKKFRFLDRPYFENGFSN